MQNRSLSKLSNWVVLLLLLLGMGQISKAKADERSVLCEIYLRGATAESAALNLEQKLANQHFAFFSKEDVKAPGAEIFGLKHVEAEDFEGLQLYLEPDPKQIDYWILKIKELTRANVRVISELSFPDRTPILWKRYNYDFEPPRGKPSFRTLVQTVRLGPLLNIQMANLGHVTDVDSNGARKYFMAREQEGGRITVELGIDVPCRELKNYVQPRKVELYVLTNGTEFCRVPVITFASPTLVPFDPIN